MEKVGGGGEEEAEEEEAGEGGETGRAEVGGVDEHGPVEQDQAEVGGGEGEDGQHPGGPGRGKLHVREEALSDNKEPQFSQDQGDHGSENSILISANKAEDGNIHGHNQCKNWSYGIFCRSQNNNSQPLGLAITSEKSKKHKCHFVYHPDIIFHKNRARLKMSFQ